MNDFILLEYKHRCISKNEMLECFQYVDSEDLFVEIFFDCGRRREIEEANYCPICGYKAEK